MHAHACKHTRSISLVRCACREKGSDILLGGVSVEYDPAAGPTKFMVGCEQGERCCALQPSHRTVGCAARHVSRN
jgi:hypothetical protein